ncbi:hypothetical protein ACRE_007670 [Hapsidospora chrysogenum ATCC 11550]|uniref:Uncharacterized protein n=1 Tax=Hapsidospora chrysogenum (strain ATCC 11550 / CBS 779.69 / DSM 880 / IAM 14645 / JCM 23072 / IMI 49137) TaxID=857340 RepID=A0A086TFZ5_HAPC1|nr:hypothetical protein ACRE_007670 [Hapsidospora chrysogenum ATCC 11550]
MPQAPLPPTLTTCTQQQQGPLPPPLSNHPDPTKSRSGKSGQIPKHQHLSFSDSNDSKNGAVVPSIASLLAPRLLLRLLIVLLIVPHNLIALITFIAILITWTPPPELYRQQPTSQSSATNMASAS